MPDSLISNNMRPHHFLSFFVAFVALSIAAWFVNAAWLSQPRAGAPVEISVQAGMTGRDVRELLVKNKLVSGFGYALYGKLDPTASWPKPGVFAFRPGTSYHDIARTLAVGVGRAEIDIRIVEGTTLNEERDILVKLGASSTAFTMLAGSSYNADAFDPALVKDYPFLASIPKGMSLEGYLFPDTYRVWKDIGALPDAVVRKQLDAMNEKVIKPYAEQQKASGMTWHEILTLASIVDAEAITMTDRKLVAGVFLNRLEEGMAFQSDATIHYVDPVNEGRATYSQLAIDSPYNTYKYPGLPPGPINNPALSAITAVLEPTESNYFFFLSDKSGRMYYARTGAEHQANRARAYGE
jgi:UPF0755 protein